MTSQSTLETVELGRCLHQLVTLFPEPFRVPEIVIETGYPPLPETPLEPDWGLTLYGRDLVGSSEEVLTILLHKAIHTYHAFLWQSDCNCWSYHTRRFQRLAEQLGFQVGWNRRYGWAQTLPTPDLCHLFEELDLALPSSRGRSVSRLLPSSRRPRLWPCGQQRFPNLGERRGERRSERPVRSLRVHDREGFPMIRMSGRWLRHLGFRAGRRLKVEGCDGRLTIEARPEVKR
jgi:hypothetical protein